MTAAKPAPPSSRLVFSKDGSAELGQNKSAGLVMENDSRAEKFKITLKSGSRLGISQSIAGNASLDLTIVLEGEGASVDVSIACAAEKSERQKAVVNVIHSAPKTNSLVRSKGAAFDSGSIDLTGLAKVEKGAVGSVSRVECRALLVGEKARARADPLLEILENDVDCSHAASISEIDRNKIFYLQTRGLSEEEANKLIVGGFLGNTRQQ